MRSLEGRLILITAVWTVAAIALVTALLGGFAERSARRALELRLATAADQLASNMDIGSDGTVTLGRLPDEAGFTRSRSGWYWLVVADGKAIAQSRSFAGREPAAFLASARGETGAGTLGEHVAFIERRIPDETIPARLMVTAPLAEIEAEVAGIRATILWVMLGLALALIAGITAQIRWGLRPVRQLASDIELVRAGEKETVARPDIANLREVAEAVNRLITQLAATAERSRQDAANLAHAIKTPLSVIILRAGQGGAAADPGVLGSAEQIQRQVDRRLKRGRGIKAGLAPTNTPIAPVVDDATFAAGRVHGARGIRAEAVIDLSLTVEASREDLEEIVGNLVDNAFKWAASKVTVEAIRRDRLVTITIEDDGPGIAEDALAAAGERGTQLDETVPGAGLGLAIVHDLVADLGGTLVLSRGRLGGLEVAITLAAGRETPVGGSGHQG
ncbi:sensor histidine kinase [Phreatobacter stygius]|uniref:histidine kinase n=1 Tax=Phreatobacter stygius TaxID=1940610 RepID=A0A4D7AZW1_9HYPH|nr:HAMP domain-containing sensor histidine kinase [Phreatobacter stygius]QCI66889.1 HAMP domain-containing histidine kinase [Phreatobacter stygius]